MSGLVPTCKLDRRKHEESVDSTPTEGHHDTAHNEPDQSNTFPILVVIKLNKKKNEVCVCSVPTEGHHDVRSSLNERNSIEEECLGDVHGTTSQGSSQDDMTTEGTGISPIQL